MTATDTIVAVATAPGRGGVGVVRLSGPASAAIVVTITGAALPPPRLASLRDFRDGEGVVVDRGLLLWFPAPHSYTGEDVAELQAHGGPVLLDALCAAACRAGARIARAGEFTERAYLNGQIDLAQAEAVADLIDAGSRAALRAASRTLQGEFSARVDALVEQLIRLRAELEAALDFSDEEDVPTLAAEALRASLATLRESLASVQRAAAQGRRLREGLTIAIIGQPNVGKSTLLNRLAGAEAAIVSPIAGTTRDVLREHLLLDGLPVTVLDTAGLRETDDVIEREGVRRAYRAIDEAELLLYLLDDLQGHAAVDAERIAALPPGKPRLVLRNKCDATGTLAGTRDDSGALRIAASTGAGIPELIAALHAEAGLTDHESLFAARTRHLEALAAAAAHVDAALAVEPPLPELLADELRLAQHALDEITGRYSSDDLLGRIFSQFCIGK